MKVDKLDGSHYESGWLDGSHYGCQVGLSASMDVSWRQRDTPGPLGLTAGCSGGAWPGLVVKLG